MVRAFLIHPLRARPGEAPDPCRPLFCRVFAGPAEEPPAQKERLRAVASSCKRTPPLSQRSVNAGFLCVLRRVETAFRLQQTLSGKHLHQPLLSDEAVSLPETPSGVFRLPAGDPFPEDVTVLWLGVQALAFVLVCDPEENLMLAEATLKLLANALREHLKLLTPGSEALLKADRTEVILQTFLPHGQLLFLNDQFVAGLDRELSLHLGK